jgi:hypothetical protein
MPGLVHGTRIEGEAGPSCDCDPGWAPPFRDARAVEDEFHLDGAGGLH